MCVCVYLTVIKLAAMCIIYMLKLGHYRVLYGILNICSVHVDLAENALFKSYLLTITASTIPDKLSMDKCGSDGFFLR